MTCQKIPFDTRKEALKYIRVMKASRTMKFHKKLRVYECPLCGKHHLTTQVKTKKYKQLARETKRRMKDGQRD